MSYKSTIKKSFCILNSKISQREQWTSKLGFILAAAGSAVGLGNLWGFAYRASQGGGAAFVVLYILIVLIVCLPVFVAEMALGRSSMASSLPVSYTHLTLPTKRIV